MDNKGSTGSVISSYRKKRQQSNVIFVYGVAGLLVLSGLALLIIWLTGPSKPLEGLFATITPTPTLTFTPTITPSPTDTPTITPTSTLTPTLTPSAPFQYTVQEGDNLQAIATKFGLGDDGIQLIMYLNPYDATTGVGIDPTHIDCLSRSADNDPQSGYAFAYIHSHPAESSSGTKSTLYRTDRGYPGRLLHPSSTARWTTLSRTTI